MNSLLEMQCIHVHNLLAFPRPVIKGLPGFTCVLYTSLQIQCGFIRSLLLSGAHNMDQATPLCSCNDIFTTSLFLDRFPREF